MNLNEFHQGTYGSLYYVQDMNKAIEYYKNNFEWELLFQSPDWSEFKVSPTHSLCLHIAKPDQKIDGKSTLITRVKNLDQVVTELKNRGVEFKNEIHQVCEGGFSADFIDPSGNIISLFEFSM